MMQTAAKPRRKSEPQLVNLVNLIERFGSEDRCRDYLEALRWPEGVECPRCQSKAISRIVKRNKYDCDSCRYQFSVKAGTVFHDSHLPLWKWFLAVYLMTESRKGISANQVKRTLGVSYKTAWYLCHRVRWALRELTIEQLGGIVEVDETFIGGRRRHVGSGYRGNKTMVLGAFQRGGPVRFRVETRPRSGVVLKGFIQDFVKDDAIAIYTDENPAYRGIGDEDTRHETVDHSKEEWVRGDVSTNTVENAWSLFKRSIVGSYHQLSVKHLAAYLDEFAFRFNNRENPYLFRDVLMKLLEGDTLTYKMLTRTAGEAPAN